MQRFGRVQEDGLDGERVEGRDQFLGDVAGLAHANDDQFAVAPVVTLSSDDGVDGAVEPVARNAVGGVEVCDAGERGGSGVEEVHGAREARLDGELLFTCCDGGLDEVVQRELVNGRAAKVVFGWSDGRRWRGTAAVVVVEVVQKRRLTEDVDLAVVDGPMFNHGCGCGRRLRWAYCRSLSVVGVPTFGCGLGIREGSTCRYLEGLGMTGRPIVCADSTMERRGHGPDVQSSVLIMWIPFGFYDPC